MTQKKILIQDRVVARLKKELEPIIKEEAEARRLWTVGYKKYNLAVEKLNNRRKKGLTTDVSTGETTNLTVKILWETLDGWTQKSQALTKRRDDARRAMEEKKQEIFEQEKLLREILHEHQIQMQQIDGIVEKTFILNEGVVVSLETMDKYLAANIFPQLHEKGTQKAIENSTSTKKVVIMTNSINIMDVAKVQEASSLITAFFDRIAPKSEIPSQDETVTMLSDLVKELLDVKIRVKAGPNLSKFLGLQLNEQKFPELRKAQQLLSSATNYSRSGLYVRLFTRATKNEKWQPVRQS